MNCGWQGRKIQSVLSGLVDKEVAFFLFLVQTWQEQRKAESNEVRSESPDRIPVIVEKSQRSDIPDIDKQKYLVSSDLLVGQFMYTIRKRIKLSSEKAIFIFVKNDLLPDAAIMMNVYQEHKDPDGFLYITYRGEGTLPFFEPFSDRVIRFLVLSVDSLCLMPFGLFVFLFANVMWLGWYAFLLFCFFKMGQALWNRNLG
ncbi:hypothetical protein BSKO_10959 [Bryopsis sp. KO-2023]|nr:hypothetical protein BSKO_10959 [Bryopsis sp. KO-2023]